MAAVIKTKQVKGIATRVATYVQGYKDPDAVPALDAHEVAALKAVYQGKGTEHQQRLSLNIIVSKFCLRYESPTGSNTEFRSGRQFVGMVIEEFLGVKYGLMTQEDKNDG